MDNNKNDEPKQSIVDIPQFKKMADDVQLAKQLAKWAPRLAPVARLFGIDLADVQRAAKEALALVPQIEAQIALPDRFNKLYARHGWIAYSSLSSDVIGKAVEAGERGDTAAGEQLLMDYYTSETLGFQITRMSTLENFRDRVELARLTMLDFVEARYHSCVPNLLMLIDGLASDVAGSNASFFSEKADLSAWDSIEGHPTGLPALATLMQTSRMKRRTETLSLPYRHGILHGRDLGFANRTVASKCWAALFAVGEWARTVERGEKDPPPPKPKPSFRESLLKFVRVTDKHKRWKAWKPRDVQIGRDIPVAGTINQYVAETPERRLVEFLVLWTQKNYGDMAKLVTIGPSKVDPRVSAREINQTYREYKLTAWELRSMQHCGPTGAAFDVACTIEGHGVRMIPFRVLCENDEGDFIHVDIDCKNWRIVNWRAMPLNVASGTTTEPTDGE